MQKNDNTTVNWQIWWLLCVQDSQKNKRPNCIIIVDSRASRSTTGYYSEDKFVKKAQSSLAMEGHSRGEPSLVPRLHARIKDHVSCLDSAQK